MPGGPFQVEQQDEWLWGWDPTPGIVSVWADTRGKALVWRRDPVSGALLEERAQFRPWLLLDRLEFCAHLGHRFGRHTSDAPIRWRELEGEGALRYLVDAADGTTLREAVLRGARATLGARIESLRDLGSACVLSLPPEEQYLVATGRTYFRNLRFDQLRRLQLDLETTGLDAQHDRVFLVAVRSPAGKAQTLEVDGPLTDRTERTLLQRLVEYVRAEDPDVIENHNLHGFDLPFLAERAARLAVPLSLGRIGRGLSARPARRGAVGLVTQGRGRLIAPGRELIDTMDAVLRYDFSARDLPGHGLKAVAKHFGLSGPERELIRGEDVYPTFRTNPDRVRRYAIADVDEVAGLASLLGGSAFALAQMVPRRYERLADAGAATGVLDPLLVRAYLRAGAALPAHQPPSTVAHSGAALHLFAAGVAHRVVKADVASLYPSLMRQYRIGPARDRLGALLALVDRLVTHRLEAKQRAKSLARGSAERYQQEATSAAMKIVVNSAYGYMAAGSLTRFADVNAANEVTAHGRALLASLCRDLASRGVTLIEADTDGVYFSVPADWSEAQERALVIEVGRSLPPLVTLEYEGRYRAMLSHEPKNYALLDHGGTLTLKGVAFRSSRAEPFGETFLRRALDALLRDDVPGVHEAYLTTVDALRRRHIATRDVTQRVKLSKTPQQYQAVRTVRRELPYEALLAAGRREWGERERIRVYRATGGRPVLFQRETEERDPRDYDVEYYERLLRSTFATRLARAFAPDDFAIVIADVDQMTLFTRPVSAIASVLTPMEAVPGEKKEG